MTRTISTALAEALAQSPRKGAECVVIETARGNRVAFTTWNRPLTIDLGIGAGEDLCEPGLTHSAITLALGMDAGNFEMQGPVGGDFTREAVLGGAWRNARFWLVWTSPQLTSPLECVPLMSGKVAECRVEDRTWIFENRDHADAFNQTIGRVISPYCTHDFGDALCTIVRTPYAATITGVTSGYQIAVSTAPADHFHDMGTVLFEDGPLAGVEAEIFRNIGGAIELYTGLPGLPEVGDAVTLYRGCSKLRLSDDETVPTCLSYGNVVNFPSFPDAPGTEKYMKIAEPGNSGSDGNFSGGTFNGGNEGGLTPGG